MHTNDTSLYLENDIIKRILKWLIMGNYHTVMTYSDKYWEMSPAARRNQINMWCWQQKDL